MKRQALRHPKTERLAMVLGVRLYSAWGLLEGLWQFASEYAQTGAIGKFSDCDISRKLDWDGDPAKLIGALVDCGFLENHSCCEEHRLVIHDWKDHLQDSVSKYLRRNKLQVSRTCPGHVRDMSGHFPDMSRLPDQTRPIPDQTRPDLVVSDNCGNSRNLGFDDPLLDEPAELPPLVKSLERLGTQRHMQGGWFAQRVHTASAEHGGDDSLAKLLEQAADAGKLTFKEAMAWINARVNQKSFNEAKGNSDGNGHKISRIPAKPGKYDNLPSRLPPLAETPTPRKADQP